jgi:hypothetical protein
MFYTGPLRRNTHISDTAQDYELNVDIVDDDFNLEDYDLEDLEDLDD